MSELDMQTDSKNCKRKSRWVPGSIQGKVAVTTFSAATIGLLVSLQFGLISLYWIYEQSPDTVEEALQMTKVLLMTQFAVLTVMTACFAFWAGRTFFRVAGPIYRFKKYFESLEDGRWDRACSIRTDDRLHDLNDLINSGLGRMVERVTSQHDVLREAREVIEKFPDPPESEKLAALLARIDEEATAFERRLGKNRPPANPESAISAVDHAEPVANLR